MATIIPQSELVKRAVAFIVDEQTMHPEKPLGTLIDDASMRFNLSPLEAESLCRLFYEEKDTK